MDNNRLIMTLERDIRQINRDIINPAIAELSLADITPVSTLVARARAAYLKALFNLAEAAGEQLPSNAEIVELKSKRLAYEELLAGAQALETAISRGYLDVK